MMILAASSLAAGSGALGATDRFNFAITAKSTPEALIALAIQSGITIGGGNDCRGRNTTLAGRYSVAEGLDHLLAGAACRYQFVDAHTVRVFAAPKAVAKPTPSAPAPATTQASLEPEPATGPVSELVVTATKRPGFTGDFPGALSVVGQTQLQDTGVTDTEDIARQVAGFSTTNLGPARDKILLRGLSDGAFTGRTQSTVGTYLDDAPVTYNAPDPDLRLVDIQNVEILRGPQGALYGAGSLSGVYRIVTNKPQLGVTSGTVEALGALTDGGAPSGEFDAVFNAPLGNQGAGRVVLYDDREGGYLQDQDLRESNVDLTKRAGGRVAARFLLNDHWEATLSSAVQELRSSDTQYEILPLDNLGPRQSNQVRETHHNDFGQMALTVSGEGGWGRLESSTSFVRHTYASRYDASSVLTAFGGDPSDDVGLFDEAADIRRLVQDVYWSSPETGRLHVMVGVFGSFGVDLTPSSLLARPLQDPSLPPSALRQLYHENRRDGMNEAALYGEASYDLGGGWVAAVGVRAFQTDIHTTSLVTVQHPNQTRDLDKRQTFDGAAPKVSLQKQWASGDYVYALVSTGYRAGGFNTGGLAAPPPATATFQPDHLQNFEVGGEADWLGGRLKLRSAVFYDHWSNIQTDQYLPSGLSYTANVGNGRNIGWETELSYKLTSRLRLAVNSLLDRPTVTSLNPNFAAVIGASLPGVPNDAFTGLISYDRPLGRRRTLVLTAQTAYTGSSRLTFDSRFSPLTPNYYSAELSAQVRTAKGRLAVLVSNPLDSTQNTFSYGNPFSFGQVRQVTPQRPRTISLLLSRSF